MKLLAIHKSDKPEKKYYAELEKDTGKTKRIYFGQAGAPDFTKTKDEARKKLFLDRHRAREDWTKSGVETPGFWARHILWEYPSIVQSTKAVREKFNL
jgi:hypothetical protein